jgi:hypothetical protein
MKKGIIWILQVIALAIFWIALYQLIDLIPNGGQ